MTRAWTEWPAPAKLNLFLHIVGRRADGYHLLQTLFQLLDWGDTVRLRVRDDCEIARSGELPGVRAEEDLCVRAARALADYAEAEFGVDIALDKRIPIGGGLGGGSSDAATVLVALNELWEIRLDVDELAALGLTLGADVPVFVRGHSAWAEGVGERLTPLDLPAQEFVILHPRVSVATAPLFQAAELTRNCTPATISGYLSGMQAGNVFTPLVRLRHPEVASALDWLGRYGGARLSGTGSCVFAAVESREAAEAMVAACPSEFAAYRARGLNRSPLRDTLERYRKGKGAGFTLSRE